MERDFSKFGGWLKFFSILFWINIVLCFLAIPSEAYIRLSDNPEIAHLADGVGLVESIVMGIVYWFVIQNIKIQSVEARDRMLQLSWFAVVSIFLLTALGALLSGNPFMEAFDYPTHVTLPIAFAAYLTQSKRVQDFYQFPEREKAAVKVTRDESVAVAHGMVRMYTVVLVVILGIIGFSGLLIFALG